MRERSEPAAAAGRPSGPSARARMDDDGSARADCAALQDASRLAAAVRRAPPSGGALEGCGGWTRPRGRSAERSWPARPVLAELSAAEGSRACQADASRPSPLRPHAAATVWLRGRTGRPSA
jgi:hypothetical protein